MSDRALAQHATEADRIGFYGKLRTHGDFVSSGLGLPLQTALDAWLRSGLQVVQQEKGKDWERWFEAMPTWRFIVERALWGPATVVGVMVPSVDRVGRSFPLVIATQMHHWAEASIRLSRDDAWFTAAEAIAESAGRRDFDIDQFTVQLRKLRSLRPADLGDDSSKTGNPPAPGSVWWRIDPQDRQTKGFKTVGAPAAEHFVSLLAYDAPTRTAAPAVSVAPRTADVSPRKQALVLQHRYATHPGTQLSVNADTVLVSQNPALFAIADGVGNGSGAVEASRLAIQMLSESLPHPSVEELLQEIKGKLGRAHGLLQSAHLSIDRSPPLTSIVAFCVSQDRFALLWVGDARCYLLRNGMMRCLTRDHVEIGLKRQLSRGVGTKGQLVPEVVSGDLEAGDRLLMCSAPLMRVLTERTVAEILLSAELDDVAEILVQDALIANCKDNVSVVAIDVKADARRPT